MLDNSDKYEVGIKGMAKAEHYKESLQHLKSDLEENNLCQCGDTNDT